MQVFNVTLTGKTPLIHHRDNIEWSDAMEAWKLDPNNQAGSKAGDDRTPAFRWLGNLYHDGQVVALPQDNIMTSFRQGAAMVPTGKGKLTFKAQSQSGMVVGEEFWPLKISGPSAAERSIPVAPILALQSEKDFAAHKAFAEKMGFILFVKRARIGQSKHVRVRPLFEKWSASGTIHVWDPGITKAVLLDIVTFAGMYKGAGDWRPGCKTPGPYGTFTATIN